MRPTEIEKTPSLWGKNGIQPHGIRQGGIGDCWLMATFGAFAEQPSLVKRIFNDIEEYPTTGQFRINYWLAGRQRSIVIDDRLPVRKWGKSFAPRYANQSRNGAWWVPILEKAAAKFMHSYKNLNGGPQGWPMSMMTGFPYVNKGRGEFSKMTDDQFYDYLKSIDGKGYISTTVFHKSSDKEQEAERAKYNFVLGHAFTYLTVAEYNGEKLVKIRNPWGSEAYRGPWSDKDTAKWTDDAKKALNHENANDGVWWVPVGVYRKHISSLFTLEYDEKAQIHSLEQVWDKQKQDMGGRTYKISNSKDQKITIGMTGAWDYEFQRGSNCGKVSPYQFDWFYFSLRDSNGKTLKDSYGTVHSWYAWGLGFLKFDNLPAGDYTLLIHNNRKSPDTVKGDMPFAIQTWGYSAEAPIERIK